MQVNELADSRPEVKKTAWGAALAIAAVIAAFWGGICWDRYQILEACMAGSPFTTVGSKEYRCELVDSGVAP